MIVVDIDVVAYLLLVGPRPGRLRRCSCMTLAGEGE